MKKIGSVKTAKILLAVNDKSLLESYCAFLSSQKHQIITAEDGIEVIRSIYSSRPDIVIVDYNISRLNGNYICRLLKYDASTNKIPFCIISKDKFEGNSFIQADYYITPDGDIKKIGQIVSNVIKSNKTKKIYAKQPLSDGEILNRINKILELKLLEEDLLKTILNYSNSNDNYQEVIKNIFELFYQTIGHSFIAVYLKENKELFIDKVKSVSRKYINNLISTVAEKNNEYLADSTKKILCIRDDGKPIPSGLNLRKNRFFLQQIVSKQNNLGFFVVTRETGKPFTYFEKEIMSQCAALLTPVIDNISMSHQLVKMNLELEYIQDEIVEFSKKLDNKIEERTLQLHKFYEAGKVLTTIHEPNRLLATIGAEVGAALLLEDGLISKKIEFGLGFEILKEIRLKEPASPVLYERVIDTGEQIILSSNDISDKIEQSFLQERNIKLRTLACIPFKTGTKIIGVMIVVNKLFSEDFSNDDVVALTTLASMATVAIENANLYQQTIEKTKLEADMVIAMEMQMELLPKEPPESDFFEVASMYVSADMVSGDYYDYIDIDKHRTGFTVADVTGHGVSAAFIMTLVKSCVQLSSQGVTSTKKVVESLNSFLFTNIPKNNFVSMLYAIIDTNERKLHYTSAGHNPSICYNYKTGEFKEITTEGLFLSLFEATDYGEIEIELNKGDIFFFYTDGLTEAANEKKEFFGKERIQQVIKENYDKPAREINTILYWNLKEFVGQKSFEDDVTFIVLKIIG